MRANQVNQVRMCVSANVMNVQLAAKRAGSDRDIATTPLAGFLPPGQFLSRLPIPEHPGSRFEESAQRYPRHATPTGPVGSFPGPSTATAGAATCSWSSPSTPRIGRDCQSPDRTVAWQGHTAKRRAAVAARTGAAICAAAK